MPTDRTIVGADRPGAPVDHRRATPQASRGPLQGAHPSRPERFFQSIVLNLLGGMPEGALVMTLPDGTERRFGRGGSPQPAMIRVRRMAFFRKCVLSGDIGLGESYVDGDWDTDDIAGVISWFLLNINHAPQVSGGAGRRAGVNLLRRVNRLSHLLRDNTPSGSRKNIGAHYDLSNDFFATFLDPTMTYSSGIFPKGDETLERAQAAKYDRLCRKLKIASSHHVLEIGSGWGGFAIHAAANYGCRVTTVTVSEQQYSLARARVADACLGRLIEVRLCDYRDIAGSFDHIVSIEMLEAVGHRHMESFFGACHRLLKPRGGLGLQVIISPDSRYEEIRKGVDWIQKHIFPGSLLPSVARINRAVNATGDMTLRDLKDFAPDYARTLRAWNASFNQHLGRVRDLGFGDGFIRRWNYYLGYCEAAFLMRNIGVAQMIYTRPNNIEL